MLGKALIVFSGNAFGSLMKFLRNLVLARLLEVEDYGIAATFAISLAIVEMLSELGLRQMIVQDRDGDNPRMQATLQGFQVLRACIAMIGLFAVAHPLAAFLGIPDVAWAYQVLAIVPFLRGFYHFDLERMTRRMRFWPVVLARTGPALASLLAVWPLFAYFGNYRAMLYAILTQVVLACVVSHLLAERRFSLAFDRTIIRRSLGFGWPILVNAILLFTVLQGEKLVVGRLLGMEMLAIFAMGFTLTLTPINIMVTSIKVFFLPRLAAFQDDAVSYNRVVRLSFWVHLAAGSLFALLLGWFGPAIVDLLLGEKFAALGPLLIWLGILNAFRMFKSASTLAAYALGRTGNALWGNVPRAAALPYIWYRLGEGDDLLTVIWIGILGELAGFVVSLLLLRQQRVFRLRPLVPSLALNLAVLGVLAAGAGGALLPSAPPWTETAADVVATLLLAASLLLARDLWSQMRRYTLVGHR